MWLAFLAPVRLGLVPFLASFPPHGRRGDDGTSLPFCPPHSMCSEGSLLCVGRCRDHIPAGGVPGSPWVSPGLPRMRELLSTYAVRHNVTHIAAEVTTVVGGFSPSEMPGGPCGGWVRGRGRLLGSRPIESLVTLAQTYIKHG